MDTNLVSSYSSRLHDQLDWKILSSLYQEIPYFNTNKNLLLENPKYQTKEDCENEYLKIDTVFKDFSVYQQSFREVTSYIDSDFDTEELHLKIQKTQVLEPGQYFSLAKILQLYFNLSRTLLRQSHFYQYHIDGDQQKSLSKSFLSSCLNLFSEAGDILYDKHPTLRPLWKEFKQKEQEIAQKIEYLLSQWKKQNILRVDSWDFIYGKYVLAVSSTSYSPSLGGIVYRSHTGQTFYIEPKEIRSLNLEVSELKYQLEVDLNKLLLKLSEVLKTHHQTVKKGLDFFIDLDQWISKVHFHSKLNLTKPILKKKDDTLLLKDLFHPLLENPIRNHLETKSQESLGLLISGPNTGGKSVFLKSVCLNLLLPHWGFFVPSGYAEIPYTDAIHYVSNDQQRIDQGLSSFSSEAELYLTLLKEKKKAVGPSFIFIDEIFNSTSSEEASVLAYSFLKEILSLNNCYIFLTTHHLKLKNLVFDSKIMLSAHMGFTKDTNTPTYKVILGSPGQSFALEIFASIEKELMKNTSLSKEALRLHEDYEIKLEEMLSELNLLKSENEAISRELSAKELELEKKRKALEGEIFLKEQTFKKELLSRYQKKVEKLENTIRAIKKSPENFTKKELDKKIHLSKKEARELQPNQQESHTEEKYQDIPIDQIREGEYFYVLDLKKEAKVLSINQRKKRAQVENGAIKIWIPFQSLKKAAGTKKKLPNTTIVVERKNHFQLEYKALGIRRDEFLRKVEELLFDVINEDIPYVDIIHGHGDGILKRSLYETLKSFPELRAEFLEGNDGTTRVTLKS